MDADQAKEIADNNSEHLAEIFKDIKEASEEGKYEIVYGDEYLTDTIISRLRDLGYKVSYHKYLFKYTVSWETPLQKTSE